MSSDQTVPIRFGIRPLIRLAILGLYGTLVVPLMLLGGLQGWGGLVAGASLLGYWALAGMLSQRIWVTPAGMKSDYPGWVPPLWQQRWTVDWSEVIAIEAATTGQGGLVYYLITQRGSRILIPLRVNQLPKLLAAIHLFTGIPTAPLRPYVQTWMYGGLGMGAGLMMCLDLWLFTQVAPLGMG